MTSKCKNCGRIEEEHSKTKSCYMLYGTDLQSVLPQLKFVPIEDYFLGKPKGIYCGICKEKWENCKGHVIEKKGCGKLYGHHLEENKVYSTCGATEDHLCPSCSHQSPQTKPTGQKSGINVDGGSQNRHSKVKTGDTQTLSDKRLFVHAKTLKDGKRGITWGGWVLPDYHVKNFIAQETKVIQDYKLGIISFELMMRIREKLAGSKLIK